MLFKPQQVSSLCRVIKTWLTLYIILVMVVCFTVASLALSNEKSNGSTVSYKDVDGYITI